MKREMSISIFAVLIVAAAILTVYYLNVGPTGFAVFEQNTQSSFNEGVYANVEYDDNASAVILSANQTSGTYDSKILDAGSSATWNNLTWQGNEVVFEVRACSTADCSDSNFTAAGDLNNLNLTGQYFQYQASFDSATDTLTGVAVDYTVAQQQQATPLSVSISEPTGEKDSLLGIPLTFTIAGGTGVNLTCSYDISYAGGTLVSNTGINCAVGANTQTFDLEDKGGDNTFTIYISDSSGNVSASSGFSVSGVSDEEETTTEEEEETPVEEAPTETAPVVTAVSLGSVSSQDVNQGGSGQFSVSVQNTGNVPVSSCSLKGDDSGWFSITGGAVSSINAGESTTFTFSVNVPGDTDVGAKTLGLSVDCAETTASQTFTVNILQKKLDLEILNVQRTREDRVRVDYSLTELAGEDQDVQIFFKIMDASGLEVANNSQNSSVDANETDDFRVNIPINETLEGNLTLEAAFNSLVYSSTVLEPISLGAPIGGFAIFGGEGGAGGVIVLLVVIVVLIAVFFVAKRMRESGKSLGDLFQKE